MNNNFFLLLLPFLMNKKGGTVPMEMLMNLFSNQMSKGSESMGNPMINMMMSMMNGGRSKDDKQERPLPDIGAIFGQDVRNVLNLFLALRQDKEDQSTRVSNTGI